MAKIQKYTRWLQIISVAFAVIVFAEICFKWFWGSLLPSEYFSDLYVKASYSFNGNWIKELSHMSFVQKVIGFVIDGFGLFILCMGIIAFNKLMKLLKSQIIFTSESIQLLSNLSKLALSWALYSPMRGTLLSLVTTIHKEAGNRIISAQFGLKDMINIFVFVCIILITTLMQEGLKLKKEQDLTI